MCSWWSGAPRPASSSAAAATRPTWCAIRSSIRPRSSPGGGPPLSRPRATALPIVTPATRERRTVALPPPLQAPAPGKGTVPPAKATKDALGKGAPAAGIGLGAVMWQWVIAHPWESAGIAAGHHPRDRARPRFHQPPSSATAGSADAGARPGRPQREKPMKAILVTTILVCLCNLTLRHRDRIAAWWPASRPTPGTCCRCDRHRRRRARRAQAVQLARAADPGERRARRPEHCRHRHPAAPGDRDARLTMLQWLIGFLTPALVSGVIEAYKARLAADNVTDRIAADLAAKEIEAEIEARRQASPSSSRSKGVGTPPACARCSPRRSSSSSGRWWSGTRCWARQHGRARRRGRRLGRLRAGRLFRRPQHRESCANPQR